MDIYKIWFETHKILDLVLCVVFDGIVVRCRDAQIHFHT